MSEPRLSTCIRLFKAMGIPCGNMDCFLLNLVGALYMGDGILDKPCNQPIELVGYFWFGKHYRAVKGLSLVIGKLQVRGKVPSQISVYA